MIPAVYIYIEGDDLINEKRIQELINIDNSLVFHKKLIKLFPNGLVIENLDKRVQEKLLWFLNNLDEYNDIQNPIQLRNVRCCKNDKD